MNFPRLTILVNGSADSIEAVRARGLSCDYPPESLKFLYRDRDVDRSTVASRWQRELAAFRPDLLYVLNTARPGMDVALKARVLRGIPYILDTGDAVYEMARASGLSSRWKLPLLWAGEFVLQRLASTVVVRGGGHVRHLRSAGLRHVTMIPDGYVEVPEPDIGAVNALRNRLGLGSALVVGVLGSLVYSPRLRICYGWELLNALTRLRDLDVKGVIIGDGPGRAWLEAEAARLGVVDRVVFCGRIPYPEVPLYLRMFDIALSTQTNNLPGQVRTTGKLPEYMAAGRFVIASRVGEAERLLPPEMLLEFNGETDPGYPERLAARIREVAGRRDILKLGDLLGDKARTFCSYPVLSRQFCDVVRETMERQN